MSKKLVDKVSFTPGPWRAEFPDRGVMEMSSIYASGLNDGDDPWRVAYVLRETNKHQRTIDDANARLIAAVPELWQLVREAATHFEDQGQRWSKPNPSYVIDLKDWLKTARAVLAKIEG